MACQILSNIITNSEAFIDAGRFGSFDFATVLVCAVVAKANVPNVERAKRNFLKCEAGAFVFFFRMSVSNPVVYEAPAY